MTINVAVLLSPSPSPLLSPLSSPDRRRRPVIGHGILAGKYLAEYRDSLK
jgi:hypothetical protein